MFVLDDVAALAAIATAICGLFNWIVIRPLKEAISQNNDLLGELKHELERSATDRRGLDRRIAALEAMHNVNKDRLTELEAAIHRLEAKK